MTLKEYIIKKLRAADGGDEEGVARFFASVEKTLDEDGVLEFIENIPNLRLFGTFLKMFPRYSMYIDVEDWNRLDIKDIICIIANLEYCDIDVERMFDIMYSESVSTTARSILACTFILKHPKLLQDVPMERFPIKGYEWNEYLKKVHFPPGAEELIEEQQIMKRIAGSAWLLEQGKKK